MEKRNLYIVIAIVLVIAVVLSFSNLTGQNVRISDQLGTCRDSDGGAEPEKPGKVTFTISDAVYRDECVAEGGIGPKKYLKERFCIDNMQLKRYLCYGGCGEDAEGNGYCLEGGVNEIKE